MKSWLGFTIGRPDVKPQGDRYQGNRTWDDGFGRKRSVTFENEEKVPKTKIQISIKGSHRLKNWISKAVADGIKRHVLRMNINFGDGLVAHRYPRPVDGIRVTGNQRMPCGQFFSFGQSPVSASPWQPAQTGNLFRGQHQAIRHERCALIIVCATARLGIQKITGNPGVGHLARFRILKFLETATPAAIAQ